MAAAKNVPKSAGAGAGAHAETHAGGNWGPSGLTLRNETRETLHNRHVKELKQLAAENHVDLFGLVEKDEIIDKLLAAK